MNNQSNFIEKSRNLISKDLLEEALKLLMKLLSDSPYLNELIHQSSRLNELKREIRIGTIDLESTKITKNQIRFGLIELISEIEEFKKDDKANQEIKSFENQNPSLIQISESGVSTIHGNINITGEIVAGRDIQIGENKLKKSKPFWKFW